MEVNYFKRWFFMNKILIRSLFAFIALCIILLLTLNTFIPAILASQLQKRAQVGVSIGSVGLSLDSINIQNFVIDNPTGSVMPQALSIDNCESIVPLANLLKQEIVIPSIALENVFIAIEFESKKSSEGNWTTIVGNLASSSTNEAKEEDKSVLIQKLKLTNLNISLVYKDDRKSIKQFQIPSLEFKNVSSQNGLPIAQITQIIIQQTLKEIFSLKGLQNMLKNFISPKGSLNPLNGLKGLFSMDETPLYFNEEH